MNRRLVVVGLGPAGSEYLTTRALEVIDSAEAVYLRTARHPAAAAVEARRDDVRGFDDVYETAARFDDVYEVIVTCLLESATGSPGQVCYAVPGSPSVAERTVELLRQRAAAAGVQLVVEPAVSYLDLAWDRLALDPVSAGVRLVDAASFSVAAAGAAGPLLLAQTWSRQVLSDVKLALEHPPPDLQAIILHHLGLPDERVETVDWADLDRRLEPDHLTSVYLPVLERAPAAAVTDLAATVGTLLERCPWDREQTHRSLLPYLLEETYEAIEALEGLGEVPESAEQAAAAHAEEELGDLLAQVVFHAALGAKEGLFTLSDVAASVEEKLISRHPHVFASAHADTAEEVLESWERRKDEEKQRAHLLDGIPASTPALARAEKVERKLRSVGLATETSGVAVEELVALVRRLGDGPGIASGDGDRDRRQRRERWRDSTEAVAGDLLLQLARLCAGLGIDAESALRHALDRLASGVRSLEAQAAAEGVTLAEWIGTRPVHKQQLPLC
jgi:tetrapyrrole methylase family protein/MazG family protein